MKQKGMLKRGIAFALSTLLIAGFLSGCTKGTGNGNGSVEKSALPVKTAEEVLTDVIELPENGYTYNAEESLYLAGVKCAAYTANVWYALLDTDEDTVSELFVRVASGKDVTIGVYDFDEADNQVKQIDKYEGDKDTYPLSWVEGTRWADASIIGVANVVGDAGLKNDFYLSANYEWLSENHLRFTGDSILATGNGKIVEERRYEMLDDREKYQGKDIQILRDYYDVATDWEKRNEEGIEPVKKYLKAVEEIKTLSDLTAYLANPEKDPFCNFMTLNVNLNTADTSAWILQIDGDEFSILSRYYNNSDEDEIALYREDFEIPVTKLLTRAGYSEEEIERLISETYILENELIARDWPSETEESSKFYGYLSFDDFISKCENFPLEEILNAYGVNKGTITVTYPGYMDYLDAFYTESNLSVLKSYVLTHTAYAAYEYLDAEMKNVQETYETEEEMMEASKDDYKDAALEYKGLFGVAEENAYMTYFVDEEERQEVLALCEGIRNAYRGILQSEEWLSEEGKKAAIEKLDNMSFSVYKPDELIDSSYLAVDKEASFLDAYAGIVVNRKKHNLSFVGEKRVKGDWRYDLRTEIATTVDNAFYYGSFNQFFILAGGVNEETFNRDMSDEEKFGMLGAVIGHELTHGFDPMGIQYDKNGDMVVTDENPSGWLPAADYDAFREKADKLADYFDAITPIPNASCDGTKVWGEAAADMGGITIALKMAESKEDFDYDKFFRAFARLWATQTCLVNEQGDINNEHPLRHLRVNAVVSQFDEFQKTYGIEEGDVMYLAPENRINLW